MRLRDITPLQIIGHHFSPFRFGKDRQFSWPHFILFLVLPLAIGIVLSRIHPVITDKHQGTFLAVYAILAAVLIGLLPIAQNVIGFNGPAFERKYGEAEFLKWKEQVTRLQVLRELYADICFTVLLLVVSLVPIMLLESGPVSEFIKHWLVAFIYYVGASVALSFLHITSSIYLVLDHHARHIYASLVQNGPGSTTKKDRAA